MGAEGFGTDAIGVAQVNNWFVDLYEKAGQNPFSGHGGPGSAAGGSDPHRGLVRRGDRRPPTAATSTARPRRSSTPPASPHEWDRLRRAPGRWPARRARRSRRPGAAAGGARHQPAPGAGLLHAHQLDRARRRGGSAADGPGWQERGFGSSPTWFDVPAPMRERARSTPRTRGGTAIAPARRLGRPTATQAQNRFNTMAKDWPGRPLYLQSAIAAYFASRQWVQAVRSWVADERLLGAARSATPRTCATCPTTSMARSPSRSTAGTGRARASPPGAAPPAGRAAASEPARRRSRTYFQWRRARPAARAHRVPQPLRGSLIVRMADFNPPGQLGPVPSSQDLQRSMRIVRAAGLTMRGSTTWAIPARRRRHLRRRAHRRAAVHLGGHPRPRSLLVPRPRTSRSPGSRPCRPSRTRASRSSRSRSR